MPKLVKIAIIFCVLIVLGSVGYALYRQENYQQTFVRNVERELTDEQRYKLQTRVIEINNELDTDISNEDRIKLLRNKTDLLVQLGMLEDAERSLNRALEITTENAAVYTDLFELQVEMKNYKGAERSIERALKLNPTGSRLEKYAVFAKEYLGANEDKINQVYLEALEDSGNSLAILKAYAEYKESVGNILMARDYWIRIKEKNPDNAAEYDVEINRLNEQLPEADRKTQ